MKNVHISFANEKYFKSLELLGKTSIEIGKSDEFIGYKPEDLKLDNFWAKNQFILSRPRGAGYWIWKPFLILKTFEKLEEGDVVLYSDAGLKVIDNLIPLYEVAQRCPNNGKVMFKLPAVDVPRHIAKTWTKRDCFVLMNADEPKFWNANMSNGAVSLWVKNENTESFLREWLRYLRDPRIVTDDINMCGKPNMIEFKDHRHDQSVLSILAIKYGFEMFRDPTQWGNPEKDLFSNSPYGQLFDHHRGNIK
jgi:hypothetical protein